MSDETDQGAELLAAPEVALLAALEVVVLIVLEIALLAAQEVALLAEASQAGPLGQERPQDWFR